MYVFVLRTQPPPVCYSLFCQNEILISFAVDSMRAEFLPWAKEFVRMGYTFVGTPGTAEYYCKHDVRKSNKKRTKKQGVILFLAEAYRLVQHVLLTQIY